MGDIAMMTRPRLLVIEDDAEQAEMLGEFLESEGFDVAIVGNGEDGIDRCLSGSFDAVVLDIMLPRRSGIDVLREVRRVSMIPIIMLTAKGDGVDRVVGLELGADDYLAKPYFPRELVARVRAVLRRAHAAPLPSTISTEIAAFQLDNKSREARWRDQQLDLTPTEFNLLAALISDFPDVVTKEDLSTKILARRWQAYDRSIDVHASHLRQKLKLVASDEVELETIRGVGYRLKAR